MSNPQERYTLGEYIHSQVAALVLLSQGTHEERDPNSISQYPSSDFTKVLDQHIVSPSSELKVEKGLIDTHVPPLDLICATSSKPSTTNVLPAPGNGGSEEHSAKDELKQKVCQSGISCLSTN